MGDGTAVLIWPVSSLDLVFIRQHEIVFGKNSIFDEIHLKAAFETGLCDLKRKCIIDKFVSHFPVRFITDYLENLCSVT